MGVYIAYKFSDSDKGKFDKMSDIAKNIIKRALPGVTILDKEFHYHMTIIHDEYSDYNKFFNKVNDIKRFNMTRDLSYKFSLLRGHDNKVYVVANFHPSSLENVFNSLIELYGVRHSYNQFIPHVTLAMIDDLSEDDFILVKNSLENINYMTVEKLNMDIYYEPLIEKGD